MDSTTMLSLNLLMCACTVAAAFLICSISSGLMLCFNKAKKALGTTLIRKEGLKNG